MAGGATSVFKVAFHRDKLNSIFFSDWAYMGSLVVIWLLFVDYYSLNPLNEK